VGQSQDDLAQVIQICKTCLQDPCLERWSRVAL